MLNVKAMTWALGLTGAMAFCLYVTFGLLAPAGYYTVFGLPGFRWITTGRFLLGLVETTAASAFLGWLVATLNNFFHHRWEVSHSHSH